jgi:putative transposase
MIKTLQLRVKDKHAKFLDELARQVNSVWNFCVSTQKKHGPRRYTGKTKFFSAIDYINLTSGLVKCDGVDLGSQSIQEVCREVATRTKKTKTKRWQIPRFRSSGGPRKSLGWIPFKKQDVIYKNGQLKFGGKFISLWDQYGLGNYELGTGNFSQDARGRWYFNTTIEVEVVERTNSTASIGIDLGCKDAVTCSDGTKLSGHWYVEAQAKLAKAQLANKKSRVRSIHAKVKNKRKDALHKFTTQLINTNAFIAIGDVSSKWASQTKVAKSASDAGWGMFRSMIEYKSHLAGVDYMDVPEKYTTQTCSECGSISDSSPKGIAGLRIREWTCLECGTTHDRDVNAAKNILAAGHCRLAGGIEQHHGAVVSRVSHIINRRI